MLQVKGFRPAGGGGEGTNGVARLTNGCRGSTVTAGDVIIRPTAFRVGEQGVGVAELNELAPIEERSEIRHTRRLLHVVRDQNDGVFVAKFGDQLLDPERRIRIEGGGRFVQQEDLGSDRDRPGNAKTLLLSTGEPEGAFVEFVPHFVPEGGFP